MVSFNNLTSMSSAVAGGSTLLDLPDEILLEIVAWLHPTAKELYTVGRACRRLQQISQQPVLWLKLFNDTPGFALVPDLAPLVVATVQAPGHWEGREYIPDREALPPTPSFFSPAAWWKYALRFIGTKVTPPPHQKEGQSSRDEAQHDVRNSIPVHFPTLYKARCMIDDEMGAEGPHYLYDPTGDQDQALARDEDKVVAPNYLFSLSAHTAKVYCARVRKQWVISGSRDGMVVIWRLPQLSRDGSTPEYGPSQAHSFHVADSSVIRLDFSLHGRHGKGLLITTTADEVHAWEIDWGRPAAHEEQEGVTTTHLCKLLHPWPRITDVAMSDRLVVTGTASNRVQIFDRESLYDSAEVQPLKMIRLENPVVALAMSPSSEDEGVVVACKDGSLHHIDLNTLDFTWICDPEEELSGGALSVAWDAGASGDQGVIMVGYQDGKMGLFQASCGVLLRDFGGAPKPIRSVALNDARGIAYCTSTSRGNAIDIWDIHKGQYLRSYDARGSDGAAFQVDLDGLRLAVATNDGSVDVITFGMGLPYQDLFA